MDTWGDRARYRLLELPDEERGPVWAVLGRRTELRHGMLPVRVLALNESVVEALDQPWIEHNGFYGATPADFPRGLARLLRHLSDESDWDELRLSGLVEAQAHEALYLAARFGFSCRIEHEHPSFRVNLAQIRAERGGDYLAALSANTRQQLRRSRRLAERTLGPVVLDEAESAVQAREWFDRTAPLHRARWGGTPGAPYASGFDNPDFVAFHHRLIDLAFESGGIQMLRLSAGGRPLAYLYNFVSGTSVQFYLSGIDYDVDEQIRPGMLAHWLAVERNLQAGKDIYDFLAGDARYKRNLSTSGGRTMWLVLQRPRWRLQFESFGRRVKQRLLGDGPVPARESREGVTVRTPRFGSRRTDPR